MRRFSILAGVIGLLLCALTARPAHAQGTAGATGTATTGTLASTDFFIGVQAVEGSNLTNFQLLSFFDTANCLCNKDVFLYYTLTSSGIAKRASTPAGTVSFWVGSSCGDPILQREQCQLIGSDQISTFMNMGRETIKTTTQVISSNSTLNTGTVDGGILDGRLRHVGQHGVRELGERLRPDRVGRVRLRLRRRARPRGFTGRARRPLAAAGAHHINVGPATGRRRDLDARRRDLTPDLLGYQILCQRAANLQVFADKTFASYVDTCPATLTDGDDLTSLNPKFVCSPLLTATASSYRVKILQNGIKYAATVVAIDTAGNASPATLVGPDYNGGSYEIPALTESFYDAYRDGNSTNGGPGQQATPGLASGGFCAIGDGPRGRTSFGLGASVLVAAALARRRRRR